MSLSIDPSAVEVVGAGLFLAAVIHTFFCSKIMHIARSFRQGTLGNTVFHILGEIEVVFAVWAIVLFVFMALHLGPSSIVVHLKNLSFVEPLFVFVVMVVSSTKSVLYMARRLINFLSDLIRRLFRINDNVSDFFSILVFGSLAGSFITEPAAITVSAILLHDVVKSRNKKFIYALLAVLFVNISVGGALTPYAAPPILMVAQKWQWDFLFVFEHFGLKSICTVLLNSFLFCIFFRNEIKSSCLSLERKINVREHIPVHILLLHLAFLILTVVFAHHHEVFIGIFILFLGGVSMTRKYQNPLKYRESFLVALFLAGIIVFGGLQKWWLQPLLMQLSDGTLFLGAVMLTAVTDNAALTFLGSQVEGLVDASKYALVSGAIAGGGLTIIANAPNAAGYSILSSKFGSDGLNPVFLFLAALGPTLIAVGCLWLLPH